MVQIAAYFSGLLSFAIVDFGWLSVMVPRFYQPALRDILAEKISAPPALIFYLLYPLGLVVLVVLPALKETDLLPVALRGALMGFICYATYDLTNQATLRAWPTALTLVDMAWGTVLSGFAAVISFWVARKLI